MIPRIVSTSSLISKTLHAGACAHPSMPCLKQNTGRILSRRMRYLPPPVGFAFASAATAGLFLPAPSIAKAGHVILSARTLRNSFRFCAFFLNLVSYNERKFASVCFVCMFWSRMRFVCRARISAWSSSWRALSAFRGRGFELTHI